ncbi:hypothetical protein ON010_g5888 [Phytophthora cinnamomi]|nr:hypothetical protein ON010_g5888 [Phytophthora cinnamomi]
MKQVNHTNSSKKDTVNSLGKASSKYQRNVPWDADNTTPTELSSLGVLLQWICVPGNYASYYKGGKSRVGAVQSILATLEEHGISHRTARGVNQKMAAIVQQYLSALEILVGKELLSDYVDQANIDDRVGAKIRQRCPHYHVVAPVLNNFNFCGKATKDWTTNNGVDDSDYVEGQTKGGVSKRKKKETAVGFRSSKRRCSPHSIVEAHVYNTCTEENQSSGTQDPNTDCSVVECTDIVPRDGPREVDGPSPEWYHKMEECKLQFVQKTTHRLLANEREKQACELKIEQYRVEVERQRLGLKKRRSEMLFKVDTMLSRQVLRDRRVPKAEIDQVLPMPEP